MMECGVARDIRSALVLLEQENEVKIPMVAELESARESSYLKYVIMSNRASTRDKLLRCQETYPKAEPTGVHSQHYVPISEQNFGDCHNRVVYEHTSGASHGLGPRVQSTGLGQGSCISPGNLSVHNNILPNLNTAPQADLPSPNSTTQRQIHNKM